MVRHWDFWYQKGKSSHPFYQNIINDNNLPKLEGNPIDMMQDKIFCSPPL